MNAPPASIRSLLLKVQALADAGMAGEAEAASEILKRLCLKHGLDIQSLRSPERRHHRFRFRNKTEEDLLNQCAHFVCQREEGDPLMAYCRPTYTEFRLSEMEAIDLSDCYKHYRKVWSNHLEEVYLAFIYKHKIHGQESKPSSDAPDKPMDPVKLDRILDMIRSMEHRTWNKPTARLTA